MKKIIATFCALLLIVAFKASAQKEQTRQVSGFTGISNNGSFDVRLKIDGTESVRVESERGEYDKIETVVEGGVLRIGTRSKLGWLNGVRGNVTIYVSAKAISSIKNNGSGDVKVEGNLSGRDLELHNSGSGAIKVEGNVNGENLSIKNNGSGDVKLNGVATVGKASVGVSGSGNITAGIKGGDVDSHLSGSGNITLSGSANNADISVSSSGQINARAMHAATVKARVTGSGNIHIGVDKTIDAHISGSGNIIYNGAGNINNIHTSGSGSIRRGNE